MDPIASNMKIVIQMLIGVGIVIANAVDFYSLFADVHYEVLKNMTAHNPLELTGYALAISASIELAYMLFTPGPDEAVDPLILGLSSAALIEVSKEKILSNEFAIVISVLIAGIGFLFWVKKYLTN